MDEQMNRYLNVANRSVPIDSIEEVSFTATQTSLRIFASTPWEKSGLHMYSNHNLVSFPNRKRIRLGHRCYKPGICEVRK